MEVLLIAVILGWVRGGRVRCLVNADIKGVWFFAVSLIITFTLYNFLNPTSFLLPILYVASFLFILTGIYINRDIPGLKTAFVGVSLNLIVIVFNNFKMPVTREMLFWITESEFHATSQALTHSVINPDIQLKVLADIFLVPPGYFASGIYSLGDLVLYFGVIWAISSTMVSNNALDRESHLKGWYKG